MTLHHSFSVDMAIEYDIELAILIHHFQYWIRFNKRAGKNNFEERTWMYQTLRDMQICIPYFSKYQIEKNIKKLIDLKILIKGNFNKVAYDRTIWYAFNDEKAFGISDVPILHDEGNQKSISGNQEMDNLESRNEFLETQKPIPDTKTDSKEKIQEQGASQAQPPSHASSSSSSKKKKPAAQEKEDNKKNYAEFVKFTEDEHSKLLAENGKDKLEWMIDKLNSYKGSKGKTYKSDYMVMHKNSWIHDSYNEHLSKSKSLKISSISSIDANKKLAQKTLVIFGEKPKTYAGSQVNLILGLTYFEICHGGVGQPSSIKFDEPQFKVILANTLDKFGLNKQKIKEIINE